MIHLDLSERDNCTPDSCPERPFPAPTHQQSWVLCETHDQWWEGFHNGDEWEWVPVMHGPPRHVDVAHQQASK